MRFKYLNGLAEIVVCIDEYKNISDSEIVSVNDQVGDKGAASVLGGSSEEPNIGLQGSIAAIGFKR